MLFNQRFLNKLIGQTFQCRALSYKQIPQSGKYISDSLTTEIPTWKNSPVLINAPTGSGKSHFILNELAEYANKCKQAIFVLSNRINLNRQQKIEVSRRIGHPNLGVAVMDNYSQFGNVFLFTYQSIIQYLRSIPYGYFPCPQPQFIVFDEVHFFCSDATFNADTEDILDMLLAAYPASVRVYMSATPEDVKPIIAVKEYNSLVARASQGDADAQLRINGIIEPTQIVEYWFEPDYSYVSLHFFYNWETVSNKISNEKSTTEKWLIFVNSKKFGKSLQEMMPKKLADYIDASDSQLGSTITSLTETNSFPNKVLISTKVIDNGISISDDDLKNIVMDFVDNVEFIQMLDRKRIYIGSEIVNVYVKIPTEEELSGHKKSAQNFITFLEQYKMSSNPNIFLRSHWGELSNDEQKLFRVYQTPSGIGFAINEVAEYQLRLQFAKIVQLERELMKDSDAYARQVCSWLHKEFAPAMYIDDGPNTHTAEELRAFFASKVGQEIDAGNDIDNLSHQIIEKYLSTVQQRACDTRKGKSRGAASIRKILEYFDLPYELQKSGTKKYCIQLKAEPIS